MSIEERNERMLNMYWNIGKNIFEIQQNGEAKAQYGTGLLTRLTEDLSTRLGKGFSRRNISYFKKFFNEYERVHVSALLTWTHYRTLLGVGDVVFRKKLELLAIVVDGDTLLVKINIGNGTNMLQRLRLRGVYAAERGTNEIFE